MEHRLATLLALSFVLLIGVSPKGFAQSGIIEIKPVVLSGGETTHQWGILSYNKLRRGTEMELSYLMSISPDACFPTEDEKSPDRVALKLEINPEPGIEAVVTRSVRKKTQVKGQQLANCSADASFEVKLRAQEMAPLGVNHVSGRVTWQAMDASGPQPAQVTTFQVPIEIVEHGDRTAKYNEAYAYRPKADLLWRVPAFPFYLAWCVITHEIGCD
jgi:hypothetical protein